MRTFPLTLVAALALASPALAAEETARSATVKYDDLDLSTKAGVAKLKQRVQLAAQRICSQVKTGSRIDSGLSKCRREVAAEINMKLEPALAAGGQPSARGLR